MELGPWNLLTLFLTCVLTTAPFFGSQEQGLAALASDYGLGIQLSQNNVKTILSQTGVLSVFSNATHSVIYLQNDNKILSPLWVQCFACIILTDPQKQSPKVGFITPMKWLKNLKFKKSK